MHVGFIVYYFYFQLSFPRVNFVAKSHDQEYPYNKTFISVVHIMKFSDSVAGLGAGLVSLEICCSDSFEPVRF